VFFIDHLLPPNESEAKFHRETREWVKKQEIFLSEGLGIGHQVSAELGLAKPGELIVHGDAHVQILGAYGAMTVSLLTDIVTPWALGEFWIETPTSIKIELKGRLRDGVQGRDVMNRILSDIGPDGANGSVIEFVGDGAETMPIDERMGMLAEIVFCGAYCGIFPGDALSLNDLKTRTGEEPKTLKADPDAVYQREMSYDLTQMTPYVITSESLYAGTPIENCIGLDVTQGYIGSCASGRKSDLDIAARILKGKKIKEGFRLYVVPSSREAMLHAARNGSLATLIECGAFISSPSCDYCYGKMGCMTDGERAVSTGTLNVPGRMGSLKAEIYLGSAATVAASAINGVIADPCDALSKINESKEKEWI
jgi:3-isopropylmalate/(R)-2-methylmalate dehydratase large subunit